MEDADRISDLCNCLHWNEDVDISSVTLKKTWQAI